MAREWPTQQRGAQVVAADAPDERRCDACSKCVWCVRAALLRLSARCGRLRCRGGRARRPGWRPCLRAPTQLHALMDDTCTGLVGALACRHRVEDADGVVRLEEADLCLCAQVHVDRTKDDAAAEGLLVAGRVQPQAALPPHLQSAMPTPGHVLDRSRREPRPAPGSRGRRAAGGRRRRARRCERWRAARA